MKNGKNKDMVENKKKDIQEQPKKPWNTPQLTIHGDVEKITQGPPAGPGDDLAGDFSF
ncbi:MAG: hypothetical protein ACE5JU_01355 [Candidatus Binatia bacterium]